MNPASPPNFRAYIQVLTERTRPEPIFVAAMTGVSYWLRLNVPTTVLIRSPSQKQRDIQALMRSHYAAQKGRAGPFGAITGYVFRSLPDRGTRYDVEGKVAGEVRESPHFGEAVLGLR